MLSAELLIYAATPHRRFPLRCRPSMMTTMHKAPAQLLTADQKDPQPKPDQFDIGMCLAPSLRPLLKKLNLDSVHRVKTVSAATVGCGELLTHTLT